MIRKIVLQHGIISGLSLSLFLFTGMYFIDNIGFSNVRTLGYFIMAICFSAHYFTLKKYNQTHSSDFISFGKVFKIGLLITVIACAFYTITWEIIYFKLMPNYGLKYIVNMIQEMKADGSTEAEIQVGIKKIELFHEYYSNVYVNSLIAFLEPLPMGLGMSVMVGLGLRQVKAKAD